MNGEIIQHNPEIPSEPEIREASVEDVDRILAIQSEKLIVPEDEASAQHAKDNGFLVYALSAEELRGIIEDSESHIIKVAREGNQIVGYIISYDMQEWQELHPDWFSRLNAGENDKDDLSRDKVMYGRHIAVSDDALSPGLGRKLLTSTLEEAEKRGYHCYTVEVLKEPVANIRSANFVQKRGFELIGQNEDDKHRVWSVYLKEIEQS